MDEWTPLGRHRYKVSGGILRLETHGEFTEADADTYMMVYGQLRSQLPSFGILADMSHGLTVTAAARQRFSVAVRPYQQGVPIAVLGASMPVRALLALLTNARRLLYGTETMLAFFSTEAQAIAWLAQKRAARGGGQVDDSTPRR